MISSPVVSVERCRIEKIRTSHPSGSRLRSSEVGLGVAPDAQGVPETAAVKRARVQLEGAQNSWLTGGDRCPTPGGSRARRES